MNIVWVIIGPCVDSVEGLYIDGQCVNSGDDYHDKISVWIRGFIAGLRFTGIKDPVAVYELYDQHPSAERYLDGEDLPYKLSDLSKDGMDIHELDEE